MTAISIISSASVRMLGLRPAEARAAAKTILEPPAQSASAARSAAAADETGKLSKGITDAKKEAASRARTQAREKLERIREELKLIKKIWASNPKEMVKQLARVSKELAAAAKEYSKAAKEAGEMIAAPAAPSVGAVPAAPAAPEADGHAGEGETGDAADAQEGETGLADGTGKEKAPVEPMTPDPTRAEAVAAYSAQADAQTREANKAIREEKGSLARENQDFARMAKGLVKAIRELLQETKVKSTFALKEPLEKSEDYKDANETLKELEKAMDEMETEANAVLNDPVAHAERIAMIRSA